MENFLNSPLFLAVPILIGLVVGWLVRERMLLREFNARLSTLTRDLELARTQADGLREEVSLLEVDAKKAAFDNQTLADRLTLADANRLELEKAAREANHAAEALKKDLAAAAERETALSEQILGLRSQLGRATERVEDFSEKEVAEKRIHEDFAAAVQKVAELEKQVGQLSSSNSRLTQEKESLQTQLLDYQLKTAEMPGLIALANGNGASKSRGKKGAAQPVAAPQNGEPNGESNPEKTAPAAVEADDLKIINTITAAHESELASLGITTLRQLAELSEGQRLEIAEGSSRLAKKMEKEDWVGQARHVVEVAR